MFASRFNPITRFARGSLLFRVVFVTVILGLLGAAGFAAVHLWVDHQFRAAQTAFDGGRYADARDHIHLCFNIFPNDADAHFLAARIERRSSKYKEAEIHLDAYKRLRGATDEFQTEWILLRAQAGESPTLESALWNCVQNNHPQTLEILETLAACFMREGRFSSALACVNEWLKREPTNLLAREWHGLVKENLQARDEAVADYRKVLELAPDRWHVRLHFADLLITMTRYSEAARHLEILNASHAEDVGVQLAWGQCLLGQGKSDEARAVFLQLVPKQPKQTQVFYCLGKLEADASKAEKWFRQALEIQPDHLESRFALYTSLRQQAGRGKEAADELRIYKATHNEMEQIKKLQDQLQADPNNVDLLSKVGGKLVERFDSSHGLYLLNRALAFDPGHQATHEILARYYEKHKQPEDAARHREAVLGAKR
jgi:tetratricopeptide (TPR) repeat protein